MSQCSDNSEEYNWLTKRFTLGPEVCKCKFGKIHLAKQKENDHIVSVKILDKSKISEHKMEKKILREIENQTRLWHPKILKLHIWFCDDTKLYLISEYAPRGSLYEYLRNAPNSRFPERVSAKYTKQIASALHFCHRNRLIYRDLKPENILVMKDWTCKLANFEKSVHGSKDRRITTCSKIDYSPPEMVNGRTYNRNVDNWGLGVLCYEFLVGSTPFKSDNVEEIFDKINSVDLTFPEYISHGAIDLICKLLVHYSPNRLSLPGVKKHPWIKKYRNVPHIPLVNFQDWQYF